MAELLRDDIDFSAYMRDTEFKASVRKASDFAEDLAEDFDQTRKRKPSPSMFSSKLGRRLEFRPGEVTIWAGYNGHRKSTFAGQVKAELCKQGQRVLAASFEMLPKQTLGRMMRQTLGGNQFARSTIDAFSRWTDGKLWIFDHMGRITPAKLLGVCNYFAAELQGQHVFVDSMMMVCESEESMDEQKQFMTDLVRIAQETGLHVHLIAHCRKPASGDETKPPTKYDIRGSAAISDQAHNVVIVWFDRARAAALDRNPHDEDMLAKPSALITVEKQRNGSFEGRLKFWQHDASMRFTDERNTPVEPWPLDARAHLELQA